MVRTSVSLAGVLLLLIAMSNPAFAANTPLLLVAGGGIVRFELDFISQQPGGEQLTRGILHIWFGAEPAVKVYEQPLGQEVVTSGIAYQPRNFVYNWTSGLTTWFETPDDAPGRIRQIRFEGRATTYGVQVIHWLANGQYMATNNPYLVLPQGLHYESVTLTHELVRQSNVTLSSGFTAFYESVLPGRLQFLRNITNVPYGGEDTSPFEVTGEVDYIGTDVKGSLRIVTGDSLERTLPFRVTRLKIVGGTITGELLRPDSLTDELYIISVVSILSESQRAVGPDVADLIQFYYFPKSLLLGELRSRDSVEWQKGINTIRIPVNVGEDYRPIAAEQLLDLDLLRSQLKSLEQDLSDVRAENSQLQNRITSLEAQTNVATVVTFVVLGGAGAVIAILLMRRRTL